MVHGKTVVVGSSFALKRLPVPPAQRSFSQISLRRMNQGTYGAL
jgi:hypothetical protein